MESLKSGWYLWLFPLAALGISCWLFLDFFNERGPEVHITFEDASGIQAGKTRVRFRGVSIGTVEKTLISGDNRYALVTVVLQRNAAHFAVDGSQFWLVLPKVGFQGVSGLETLFEGTYIAVQPGPPGGNQKDVFKGSIGKEINDSAEDTLAYYLEADNVGSIGPGDNVSFRGMNIGTVSKVSLSKTSQSVITQINIQRRYAKLIRSNTVFWRKAAVQANLGLFNSEIKIGALDSLLHGGIDLATPEPVGEIAKQHAQFELSAAPPKNWEKWSPKLEVSPEAK